MAPESRKRLCKIKKASEINTFNCSLAELLCLKEVAVGSEAHYKSQHSRGNLARFFCILLLRHFSPSPRERRDIALHPRAIKADSEGFCHPHSSA